MHYMTRRSHTTQNHKLSVTCPSVFFVKSVPVPHENEKLCINILRTGMHYATRSSLQRQKHKFGITCTSALFVKSIPVPPEHEK
jgi:hypothetical protein